MQELIVTYFLPFILGFAYFQIGFIVADHLAHKYFNTKADINKFFPTIVFWPIALIFELIKK